MPRNYSTIVRKYYETLNFKSDPKAKRLILKSPVSRTEESVDVKKKKKKKKKVKTMQTFFLLSKELSVTFKYWNIYGRNSSKETKCLVWKVDFHGANAPSRTALPVIRYLAKNKINTSGGTS
jgi:hypothetical protein